MWVRVTAASMKARRTGAVLLHLYAASYGRWLLSKAHPPPSPFRATGLLLGLGPCFLSCLSCLVANFATGRLSDPVKRFTIEAVVACALGAQTVHSHCFPAHGLWVELSDQTEFPDHGSSPEPQSDNLGAHFLRDAEKCCDFPITRSLPRFSASLPAGSPRRFAGTVWCVPQMAHRISWTSRLDR